MSYALSFITIIQVEPALVGTPVTQLRSDYHKVLLSTFPFYRITAVIHSHLFTLTVNPFLVNVITRS